MTNRIAFIFGAIIVALVLVDVLRGSENIVFLARKFLEFLDWLAFWR